MSTALFSGVAFADTEVSGVISTDTIWDKAGNPYIVKGHILVDTGATLTITEGVNVLFDGNYYLQVRGSLIAQGTNNNLIYFKSNSSSRWDKINLKSKNNFMEYCVITDCKTGILDESQGIYGDRIPNIVNYCIIEGLSYGICFDSRTGDSIIKNCIIRNSDTGIYSWQSNEISYNTIYNCNYGIRDVSANVHYNNIYNNNYNISAPKYDGTVDFTNNYWGTTDNAEISNKIYEFYDDFNLCKVIFEPFLTEPYTPGFTIISTNPSVNEVGFPVCQDININFNKNIQQGTYYNDIALTYHNMTTPSNITINNSTLTIDPLNELDYNTVYTVYIPAGAVQDELGNTMSSVYSFSFTTEQQPTITLTQISFDKSNYQLNQDETEELILTAKYSDNSNITITNQATFCSANSDIAVVSKGGVLFGMSEGDTVITANYNGKTATASVTVDSASGILRKYCDVNEDGQVNILDLLEVSRNIGK